MNNSLIRFLLVGLSNTAVGLGVIYFAWRVLGLNDYLANATGYLVGFVWSTAWNRHWVFRAGNSLRQGVLRYLLVCVGAYAANVLVLQISRSRLGADTFWPQIAALSTYTVLAYLGSRFYAFRSEPVNSAAESTGTARP